MRYAGNCRVRRCSDARRPGRLQRSRRHGRRNRALEAVGEGLVLMYLLQPRLLKSGKGVLEGHRHADSDDCPRRLVRHNCRDAEPRDLRPRPARAGLSEPRHGAWRSRHCVTIVKWPKEHSGRAREEGFPTYIRIAVRVGHRRPIDASHLCGVRRDAHGTRSANQRSEYIFLTHEAITRSMTGGRLKHLALVRLRDKHGHIMLRHCCPHSANDVLLGGRSYGAIDTRLVSRFWPRQS